MSVEELISLLPAGRPDSLESIVKVSADKANHLRLTLYLLLHLPDGSTRAIERSRLKKYWYQDAVYIPEQKVLATWKSPDRFKPLFGRHYTCPAQDKGSCA